MKSFTVATAEEIARVYQEEHNKGGWPKIVDRCATLPDDADDDTREKARNQVVSRFVQFKQKTICDALAIVAKMKRVTIPADLFIVREGGKDKKITPWQGYTQNLGCEFVHDAHQDLAKLWRQVNDKMDEKYPPMRVRGSSGVNEAAEETANALAEELLADLI